MRVEIHQNRSPLPMYHHLGKAYLLAPPAGEYEIALYNDTAERVEVVLSVDGLSVMTGEVASKSERGYVLSPWQTSFIPGWRRGPNDVARFAFTEMGSSYSAQMGKGTANTSVIGVAVYKEKSRPTPRTPTPTRTYTTGSVVDIMNSMELGSQIHGTTRGATKGFGTSHMVDPGVIGGVHTTVDTTVHTSTETRTSAGLDLGTAYGSLAAFHTSETSFTRSSVVPLQTIVIRYGTREKLMEWGVPLDQPSSPAPNPFPAEGCPAPAGWSR